MIQLLAKICNYNCLKNIDMLDMARVMLDGDR